MIFTKLKKIKGFTPTPKNFGVSLQSKRGFTILESIVAIAVLSLSISGAFSAVQQSLSQTTIAKDEVKAFYLAQEAVEMIRNIRDTNQIVKINSDNTRDWLSGITSACPFGRVCSVSAGTSGFTITDCGASFDNNSCPVLNQDTTTFVYNHDAVSASNVATNFKREIQFESINPDEISITVRITWSKGLIDNKFEVKTLLLNWI
ncbi:MAG: type II secretion system protein [Patescibacteria group bacterium]